MCVSVTALAATYLVKSRSTLDLYMSKVGQYRVSCRLLKRASVKAGDGNGIGNWKRNWKLEMVVKI